MVKKQLPFKVLDLNRKVSIGGICSITDECYWIPSTGLPVAQRFGFKRKLGEYCVPSDPVEPVTGVKGVGLLTVKDGVPVAAIHILNVLSDRMRFLKTTYI